MGNVAANAAARFTGARNLMQNPANFVAKGISPEAGLISQLVKGNQAPNPALERVVNTTRAAVRRPKANQKAAQMVNPAEVISRKVGMFGG